MSATHDRLATIEDAAAAIARGEMIVLVDAPDRENEGDLVMAAEFATPEAINFMATHARGLICVPMTRERLDELRIPPMVTGNGDTFGTAFHISVDHRTLATTGISASDRSATIRALASPTTTADTLVQPGHVFPLAYREGGVLHRAGHTEASVDLTQIAGVQPAAVICEIAKDDGEMARLPDLYEFAAEHGLLVATIQDLIEYRRRMDRLVCRTEEALLPLDEGAFRVIGFRDMVDGHEHCALLLGAPHERDDALVRVHSECLTGDVFGSCRCDCGRQLKLALRVIAAEGCGAVIYLRGHEGRGVGLMNKIHAYNLQDQGLDTVDANVALGLPVDRRDYGVGMQILQDLGIRRFRLLSNNPDKRAGLEGFGLKVVDRVPLVAEDREASRPYLDTKAKRLGHLLAS